MAPWVRPSDSPASLVSLERAKASPATPKSHARLSIYCIPKLPNGTLSQALPFPRSPFPSNVRKLARQHQKPGQTVDLLQCEIAGWHPVPGPQIPRLLAKPSDSPASFVSLERAKASPATPKATPDYKFIAFRNCRMARCFGAFGW